MDITEKQQNFISIICHILDIEFKGFTKYDASKFISENIVEFKRQQVIDNALNEVLYEEHGFL